MAYHETVTLTQAELQAALEYWQPLLGLADWHLDVVKKRTADGLSETAGAYYWGNTTHRVAEIWIRHEDDPVQYENDHIPRLIAADMEHGLVHELLHVHFATWEETEGVADTCMEQTINALAHALVKLKRQAGTGAAPSGEPPAFGGPLQVFRLPTPALVVN